MLKEAVRSPRGLSSMRMMKTLATENPPCVMTNFHPNNAFLPPVIKKLAYRNAPKEKSTTFAKSMKTEETCSSACWEPCISLVHLLRQFLFSLLPHHPVPSLSAFSLLLLSSGVIRIN